MNLSISQSFLLLTVPEKGSFSVLSSYENWLIASAILELILSDVADLSDEKIMIVRDLPPKLSYLSGLYQFLMIYEGSLKNAVLSFGMEDLGRKQRQVLTGTFESLSALGLVTPQLIPNAACRFGIRSIKHCLSVIAYLSNIVITI